MAAVSSHASIQLRIALDETPCDSGVAIAQKGVCASMPRIGDRATAKAIVIIFILVYIIAKTDRLPPLASLQHHDITRRHPIYSILST